MAADAAPVIDLAHVSKRYRGKIQALQDVAMRVHAGEIFGLLGPNGAGKSTLVKIIVTVVRPTRAEGTVLGHRVGDKSMLSRVGYLPEHHRFPAYLTGRQAIEFSGAMSGMTRADRRRRTDELLDVVRMREWAHRRIGSYSKGMQQRVGLAAAMVHDPDLILLDEPTDGVDPAGRREIRDVLTQLKAQGKSVFVNSHILSELEMVCDRVAIMVQGNVAAQGTIDELTNESRRVEIEIDGDAPSWTSEMSLESRDGTADGRSLLVRPGGEVESMQDVIDRLRGDGRTIRSLRAVRESLEDLFMRAVVDEETGGTLGPGAASGGRRAAPPTASAKGGAA